MKMMNEELKKTIYKENLKKIPQEMISILKKLSPNDIEGDIISRIPGETDIGNWFKKINEIAILSIPGEK